MKIISIGDLVTDFYYKNGKLIGINGGMTSHNIIANLSKMGLNTAVYGVCGNDMTGNIAINSLKDIGVNIDNIKVIDDIHTRTFHVSYIEKDGKLEFTSKKRCPICNEKKWYDDSKIEINDILNQINKDDVLIFDNLNEKNQAIIDSCTNRKMLDLGQYFELENYNDRDIINKIKNKFDFINLNERVEKYLKTRFSLKSLEDIYNLLQPKMIIITRGKKGSDFILDNKKINKELNNPENEIDPTGAGDAFFSVFIGEYIKNEYVISDKFIDSTFEKATKLTRKVVKKFGARGHLQNLYKIAKVKDSCTSSNFDMVTRKRIKRCNININHLETRVLNAINSNAYEKLEKIDFSKFHSSSFIGTGGSLAGAKFCSKVINELYGINTMAYLPRDFYYQNNSLIDTVFLFSYSGTTNDLIISTNLIPNDKKYMITKGEIEKVVQKIGLPKSHVLTYRNHINKGKERGFLSFEGTLSPASLFLKLYFLKHNRNDINDFIKECLNYWKNYFKDYFKKHQSELKDYLKKGNSFNIFTGDNTLAAGIDLESKLIESGIYHCLVHEKKNFSHGRFIHYEHISEKRNIYFKAKDISNYEEKLLEYLKNDNNLIIESRYNGILCEYDLLVASQYLIYYISNYLDIDISKPSYSEKAIDLYFYKGNL